jgi:hypothetical protein
MLDLEVGRLVDREQASLAEGSSMPRQKLPLPQSILLFLAQLEGPCNTDRQDASIGSVDSDLSHTGTIVLVRML